MSIGDTYRLRLVWRHDANLPAAINDFYYRQETLTIFDTPEEDLWQAFEAAVMPSLPSLITNQLALFTVAVGKEPLFETAFQADSPGYAGGATGDALPPTTCTLISRKSALLTRRGRGRIYVPAGAESFNGNGKPTSTYLGAVQTVISLMFPAIGDGITTAEYTFMTWSPSDQIAREVTSCVVRDYWAIQRDRRGIF